jgi:acyl-CoA oxidase
MASEHGGGRYLNRRQMSLVRQQVRALLGVVRPNAVALVDAWSFHDYELNSALGRHDGDVYNALYQWAKRNPVNAKHTGRGYEAYLKPLFTSNL